MFHAAIAGTGRAVPAKLLTNADLEKLVETTDEWITTRTGIRERHIAADGETLSDLCVEAAKRALEGAGVLAKDLDAVLVATVSPDQPIPSAACPNGARKRFEMCCGNLTSGCPKAFCQLPQ